MVRVKGPSSSAAKLRLPVWRSSDCSSAFRSISARVICRGDKFLRGAFCGWGQVQTGGGQSGYGCHNDRRLGPHFLVRGHCRSKYALQCFVKTILDHVNVSAAGCTASGDKESRQGRNIFPPFRNGGTWKRNHLQAIKQIVREGAFGDEVIQIAVRGRITRTSMGIGRDPPTRNESRVLPGHRRSRICTVAGGDADFIQE